MVNVVTKGGRTSDSETLRQASEPVAVTQVRPPVQRGGADVPLAAQPAAVLPHLEYDPSRGMVQEAKGAAVALTTQYHTIPSSQAFLNGLLAGSDRGQHDCIVPEAVADAILLRDQRPVIRLKHKYIQVRVQTRQQSTRKFLVKRSQANTSRAAVLRVQKGF